MGVKHESRKNKRDTVKRTTLQNINGNEKAISSRQILRKRKTNSLMKGAKSLERDENSFKRETNSLKRKELFEKGSNLCERRKDF